MMNKQNIVFKVILFLALLSFCIVFFCDKTFFERYFSADSRIAEPTFLIYIYLFRLAFIIIGVTMLISFFFRKSLSRDWKVSLVKFKYAHTKKLTIGKLIPHFPRKLQIIITIILSIWAFFILYGFCFHLTLLEKLTRENGVTETLTVIFYLLATTLALAQIWYFNRRGIHIGVQKWWLVLGALFFLFIAMEEMNWGQTYFKFKTPDILSQANFQQEISLHNIPLPFYQNQIHLKYYWVNPCLRWLAVSIGIIIPAILWMMPSLARLFWSFGIPLPFPIVQFGFIVAALIPSDNFMNVPSIRLNFPSELREVTFALSFLLLIWSLYYTDKQALEGYTKYEKPD